MRRGKNIPDPNPDLRPKLTLSGIGRIFGVSRTTMYNRIKRRTFSLDGIPVLRTRNANLYDMEAVFRRVFPSADSNTISELMYDFMQRNRGIVK